MKQLNNETIKLFLGAKKILNLFLAFLHFFIFYLKQKVTIVSLFFEGQKNILVRFFTMKRGRYNRPFLHIGAMVVLSLGVIVAPFLADRYPIFISDTQAKLFLAQAKEETIALDKDVFETDISDKPRDKVIVYMVQKGDTIITIAKKYGISADTVRWANNIVGDNLTVGDELKIPPVTGLIHKVVAGDTVYIIAKKYDSNPQAIVDFPFNDFVNPQTFALVVGQTLVVPDGVKPNERVTTPRQQVFIAQGPVSISAFGFTWPLRGGNFAVCRLVSHGNRYYLAHRHASGGRARWNSGQSIGWHLGQRLWNQYRSRRGERLHEPLCPYVRGKCVCWTASVCRQDGDWPGRVNRKDHR